jgi:hypothetical protein
MSIDLQKAMEELQKPFPAEDIEWRVQRVVKTSKGNKAVVLAYVTNRAIQNRLDEVFGIGNWKNEFMPWRETGVLCGISVKINGEWVTKWDGAEETRIEAVKGGFSGSMKRAAVQWGIGRYLYNLPETWVDIKEQGEHYIYDKATGISGYWDTPQLPAWALPADTDTKDTSGKQQKEQQPREKRATNKQLNCINTLLDEVANALGISKQEAYATLKKRLGTTNEMENFTMSEASKAIEILNEAKKGKAS